MQTKIPLQLKLTIILLWALPQMSTDIYLPSLPDMARYFHTSISMVQYTVFFYTIAFSLGALIAGPISDRAGRRIVILWSLALALIASLLALISTSLDMLFAARFLQGLTLAGISSTMRALTKDVCPDKNDLAKFGAILGIIMPLATALAPIIGGYIEHYLNWRFSFAFLLIYILIFLIYSIKKLPETNINRLERPLKYLLLDYKEVFSHGQFLRYNAITAFALSSMFAYLTVSSYLLQIKIGLSPEAYGYTTLFISITLIVVSYINSKLITRRGVDNMQYLGCILLFSGGVLFLLTGVIGIVNLYTVLTPLVILVAGCSFIYPNASAGGLSIFTTSAGTAGAVYACVQMLGGAAGSGLISLMTKYGDPQSCLGVLIIVQGIIAIYFARQLIQKNKNPNKL